MKYLRCILQRFKERGTWWEEGCLDLDSCLWAEFLVHFLVGEMVQRLRAPATLPKDPHSSPSTHVAAYTHLVAPVPGIWCSLSISLGSACMKYTNRHTSIHMHFLIIFLKIETNICFRAADLICRVCSILSPWFLLTCVPRTPAPLIFLLVIWIGKKKSKFKTFKKLFGKKKRKESPSPTGNSAWKQNPAKSEVIAVEESGPVYDSEDELE